jgi:hypothetical protein
MTAPQPPITSSRLLTRAFAAAVAALGLVAAPRPSFADKIKDSDELNYILRVPDAYEWGDPSPFKDEKVDALADWRLETLAGKEKTPATGQGARVMLAVSDVPASLDKDYEVWLYDWQVIEAAAKSRDLNEDEIKKSDELRTKIDEALSKLAALPEVRGILLARFSKDPKGWPPVEEKGCGPLGGVEAVELATEGTCANLGGNDGLCVGRLFVSVVRKKMFRLVMWGFRANPKDREGIKNSFDTIEFAFEHHKTEALLAKKPPPAAAGNGDGGAKPAGDDEKLKRKPVRDIPYGFEVLKPEKFVEQPFDRATTAGRDVGFTFIAQNGGASALVDLKVYRIGRAGVTAFSMEKYLGGLWKTFLLEHPAGPLKALDFPPYSAKNGALSLPDPAKFKDVTKDAKRPPEPKPGSKEKPTKYEPEDISVGEAVRLGICEEVHSASLEGKKIREMWRWSMAGSLPKVGDDTQAQYCFSTTERTYVIRVYGRGGGWDMYKKEIAELLQSFRILTE